VGANAPAAIFRLEAWASSWMRRVTLGMWAASFGLAMALAAGAACAADQPAISDADVKRLFATTCGFCHVNGGRAEGKGPQLMNTTRSDEYMMNRIATGKPGRMPAYGGALSLEQIEAIIHYIRNLKPGRAAPS
jgi:mono/diheme cytochrome c family protein